MTGEPAKTTAVALPDRRQGIYDKDVEIFRDNAMIDGLLHDVRPGDCFATKDAPSRWFKCVSPITKSVANMRHEESYANPTFSMSGLEVLQAAPRVEPRELEVPKPKRIRGNSHAMSAIDIDDADFVEVLDKSRPTVADVKSIGAPTPSTGNGELPKHSRFLTGPVDDVDFEDE